MHAMEKQEPYAKSAEKVREIQQFMKEHQVRVEPKLHVNQMGIVENSIFWIDDEKYPSDAPAGATASSGEESPAPNA